jgi:hypothetical protein
MRSYISDVYPSRQWRERVAAMYEDQVIAVYHSMLNRGVFDKPTPLPDKFKNKNFKQPQTKQLSIFDFLKEDGD